MTTKELLDIAAKGYPDEYLKNFYDEEGSFKDHTGDTLAKFLVIELIENHDPEQSDVDQLYDAMKSIRIATKELHSVQTHLQVAADKKLMEEE